jgi:hypothetical protein
MTVERITAEPVTAEPVTAEPVTAEHATAGPAHAQGIRQPMVRYWITLATVRHVLSDRRFQEKVITGAIVAMAMAELGRDNKARPMRRVAGWYRRHGVGQELARVRQARKPDSRS